MKQCVVILSLLLVVIVSAQSPKGDEVPVVAKTAKVLSEVDQLKLRVQALEEQLYASQIQVTQCQLSLAEYQFKERANTLSLNRQLLDAQAVKALGGDPEKDVLDGATLTLKPKTSPPAVK